MTTKPDDGGPAFPSEQGETENGRWNQTYDPGMSLRDYFAGQVAGAVVADMLTTPGSDNTCLPLAAKLSYALADAMLVERAKGGAA